VIDKDGTFFFQASIPPLNSFSFTFLTPLSPSLFHRLFYVLFFIRLFVKGERLWLEAIQQSRFIEGWQRNVTSEENEVLQLLAIFVAFIQTRA